MGILRSMLVTIAVAAAVLTVASDAIASGWSASQMPVPVAPQGELGGISCLSASSCEAVGATSDHGPDVPLAESWDGTAWSVQDIPAPADSAGSDLEGIACAPGGGAFCVAVGLSGDPSVGLIEQWNGSSWAEVDSPAVPGSLGTVLLDVACTSASSCMAVGYDRTGSTTYAPVAEQWNGSSWTLENPPNPGGSSTAELNGISCTSAGCLAVGDANGAPMTEVWSAGAWTSGSVQAAAGEVSGTLSGVWCAPATLNCQAVGSYAYASGTATLAEAGLAGTLSIEPTSNAPSPSTESGLDRVTCTTATSCTAVGVANSRADTLIEHWDGSGWTIQSMTSPSADYRELTDIACPSANACLAVGGGPSYTSMGVTIAERWDGSSWTDQPMPNTEPLQANLQATSCTSATNCLAVGAFTDVSGNAVPLAEHWSGTAWSLLPSPPDLGSPTTDLTSLSCASATACMAVGSQEQDQPFAEEWNQGTWTIVSPPGPVGFTLAGVSCPASDDCTAVGYAVAGPEALVVEHWNGTTWTAEADPLPADVPTGDLMGVSCPGANDCTAVGSGENGAGVSVALVQHWNGTTWAQESMPNPAQALPRAISCTSADQCIAVGWINDGGTIASLAESWDGHQWAVMPTPDPESQVNELLAVSCASSSFCTATGDTSSGGAIVPLAEQFNGIQWTATLTGASAAGPTILSSASCPTTTECVAVGYSSVNSGPQHTEIPLGMQYVAPNQSSDAPSQHTLVVLRAGTGVGTVTGSHISCPSQCSGSFATGTTVTLTASPAPGARFVGWSGGDCSGTSACVVRLNADKSITATFNRVTPAPSCTIVARTKAVVLPARRALDRPGPGLTFAVRCSESAKIHLTGSITVRQRRLRHRRGLTRTFALGGAIASVRAGRQAIVTVRLSPTTVAALRNGASASVAVTLRASGAEGTVTAHARITRLRALPPTRKQEPRPGPTLP